MERLDTNKTKVKSKNPRNHEPWLHTSNPPHHKHQQIMRTLNLKELIPAALLGWALWMSPAALQAATIPVTSLADSGDGSLRAAIATAADGDTVDATGIAGTIVLASELNVDKSLTINGPGQGRADPQRQPRHARPPPLLGHQHREHLGPDRRRRLPGVPPPARTTSLQGRAASSAGQLSPSVTAPSGGIPFRAMSSTEVAWPASGH